MWCSSLVISVSGYDRRIVKKGTDANRSIDAIYVYGNILRENTQ